MIIVVQVVVTGPVFEQVAQQIELLRVPRLLLQKVGETPPWWRAGRPASADRR
jgi:hypothetical protein